MFRFNLKYFIGFTFIFVIELYIALYVNDRFIRPYLGDVLVIILIYCFIRSFICKQIKLLPMYIFIFATMVELCQLIDFITLIGLDNNKYAKIIFGTVFDFKDIICYLIGSIILVIWQLYMLPKISNNIRL